MVLVPRSTPARASTRRSSARAPRRVTCCSDDSMVACVSTESPGCISASSSSPRTMASGVRSSWLASSTNARSRRKELSKRSNMSSRVIPKWVSSAGICVGEGFDGAWTTSPASFARGPRIRCSKLAAEIRAARSAIRRTGRNAAPARSQPPSPSRETNATPINTSVVMSRRVVAAV